MTQLTTVERPKRNGNGKNQKIYKSLSFRKFHQNHAATADKRFGDEFILILRSPELDSVFTVGLGAAAATLSRVNHTKKKHLMPLADNRFVYLSSLPVPPPAA